MSRFAAPSRLWAAALTGLVLSGCTDYEGFIILPAGPDASTEDYCIIPEFEIYAGGPGRDAVPALTNPRLLEAETVDYLDDEELVVGLRIDADIVAFPLRVLWYHEIVNFDLNGRSLAITHCPLTGSSIAFDRGPVGDAEFGVSGLLYRNNLMMYDRNDEESFWPQMSRQGACGPRSGTQLVMYPVMEMTWGAWREMHPISWVMTLETGFDRNYDVYPYGNYRELNNPDILFPLDIDYRRPLKERVLGVIDDSGGVGYPFGELARLGPLGVVEHDGDTGAPGGAVIFWDGDARTAMAYSTLVDGTAHTFAVVGGQIVDTESGSTWRVDGVATDGPLIGAELEAVPAAYISFWFAWAAFESEAALWVAD